MIAIQVIKKLKKQLRRGGWHPEARNLEKKIDKQGLPLTIPTLNGYLMIRHYDGTGLIASLFPENRDVANEVSVLYMKPAVVGRIPIYEDGVMKGYSIRMPVSLRQRVELAYPGESLGTVIRDVLATHLQAIGR